MARKGLRDNFQSRYNELDAGDEICIPLKPFLAILRVGYSCFFIFLVILSKNNQITPISSSLLILSKSNFAESKLSDF